MGRSQLSAFKELLYPVLLSLKIDSYEWNLISKHFFEVFFTSSGVTP